ncbi:uncharacterized protein LOC117178719 [Belonocnema kinseyi]|uniref:uncharacterized protein LOC117178719 n=1 Tax=Belonocnema kinseyi TaxID=2817044 RepID=UPI00143D1FB5|nr:uncharacterized protein LOC117178719 [Belonocnema kinseyi]
MFLEASKESTLLASRLALHGTEWRFNPPGAPHFGGIWEATVKSAKHHIRRVIGDTMLTYEEMSTFLVQVEACLNSKSLQSMSDDPDDLTALTLGHFLIGESLNSIPGPSYIKITSNRLSRWQLLQQMRQHFWQRWFSDYLKDLQPRSKWRTPYPSLEVGDLAFIRDENSPPTK